MTNRRGRQGCITQGQHTELIPFLHPKNKHVETEMKNTIPFRITPKKINT